MLAKLIKYDLKSLSPVLLLVHGALLILALFVRIALAPYMFFMTDAESIMSLMITILLVVCLVGSTFATAIFICVRFYKNIYSDEGYLTNTLPVTSGQLLLSKTISGSTWTFFNTMFILLALYLAFIQPISQTLTEEGWVFFGFPNGGFTVLFIVSMIVGSIANVVMYYFAIILGQLFQAHRIIGAIACYFLLNTVVSILSTLALFLTPYGSDMLIPVSESANSFMTETMSGMLITVSILSAVITVICYIISLHFMKKKRNLV